MSSLNPFYITHYLLQGGTQSLAAVSLLGPPVLGKAVKLFPPTSPKTLSLRLTSGLGSRACTWLQRFRGTLVRLNPRAQGQTSALHV